MAERTGWQIDPRTLDPVVIDRPLVEAKLASAEPVSRLELLAILGRTEQALAEAAALAERPEVRADPWQLLLATGDVHRYRHELDDAARLHTAAWKYARSRSRQASTLQQIGKRWFRFGDLDEAGGCFELALTMRRGFGAPDEVAVCEQALAEVRRRLDYDAIVLAGGRGSRLRQPHADKPGLPLAGWPLIDHVLLAVSGADRRLVAGRSRIALASPTFCQEDPPGGGPVAGIAAVAGQLRRPTVAVLAADLPFIGRALSVLRDCVTIGDRDAAVLVDTAGRSNYLASMWRTSALLKAIDQLGDPANLPVRALYEGRDVARVPDFDSLGADCDTFADLNAAAERIKRHNPGQLPAALLAWPRLELHAPS